MKESPRSGVLSIEVEVLDGQGEVLIVVKYFTKGSGMNNPY